MWGCSGCDYTTDDFNDAHFDYENHQRYSMKPKPTNTFKCADCGETCERYRGEYEVNCPKCGASHNAGGQRLRDDWRGNPSNYDDDTSDLEGFEIQHAGDN